jgi:3-keto-5-aminohexanoate cleavage enzyme
VRNSVKALQYMQDHKPDYFNYSVSDMDPPTHWQILTQSILLGGHIRVGMEDSPYLDSKGTLARSNAELVEKAVRIAREVGREIASPEEARKITETQSLSNLKTAEGFPKANL